MVDRWAGSASATTSASTPSSRRWSGGTGGCAASTRPRRSSSTSSARTCSCGRRGCVEEVVTAVGEAAFEAGVAVWDPQRALVGLPAPRTEAPMTAEGYRGPRPQGRDRVRGDQSGATPEEASASRPRPSPMRYASPRSRRMSPLGFEWPDFGGGRRGSAADAEATCRPRSCGTRSSPRSRMAACAQQGDHPARWLGPGSGGGDRAAPAARVR